MSIIVYICFALFIKLIVNNVKYGGIHYDYGQLTNTFFLFLVSLRSAVQQDSFFTDDTKTNQNLNLVFKSIGNKDNFKALVSKPGIGGNQIPDIKILPGEEQKSSEQIGKRLTVIHKRRIAKTSLKNLNFEFGFNSNRKHLPQKANHSFSVFVNNTAGNRKNFSMKSSEKGVGNFFDGGESRYYLQSGEIRVFTYSYYKNCLTTKRLAPKGFYISHEKLAIRACDLLRFLTISFLTTKSEKNNSLTSTISSSCFLAVACNCAPKRQEACVSINFKKRKEDNWPARIAC